MKILVLGAGGFIGAQVSQGLSQNHDVARADIAPDAGDLRFPANPRAADISALIARTIPEVIINCTGAASVPASMDAPARDFALNVDVVLQCLDAIRDTRRPIRFVHLSSAAVYGNPTSLPVREDSPVVPVSPYGMHKNIAEMLCRQYARFFDVPTISLRIFSAYGPGLRKQLFWDVHQKVLRGGPLQLFGTGDETRDYLYVADVVSAIAVVLDRGVFDGRAINLGSGRETSTRDAVSCLLRKLGVKRELVFSNEVRQGDPLHWRADISSLAALGFTPTFDMDAGLEVTAAWLSAQT